MGVSKKSFTLRRNKDGTVTFRCGRYVESFDARDKGLLETYEYIRVAAVTAGLSLSEESLADLMREVRGLKS